MQTQLTKTQLESGDYYKEIWELDLFQQYELSHLSTLMRVPGGWILTACSIMDTKIDTSSLTNTFIPYSEEFKPRKDHPVDERDYLYKGNDKTPLG